MSNDNDFNLQIIISLKLNESQYSQPATILVNTGET